MIKWLIKHQWKESSRSKKLSTHTGVNIAYWFFIGLMFLYVLLFGFFIDKILINIFPDQDIIIKFNGFLLYYFAIDLFMRFYLQDVPVLSIEPYLHLPVKRSKLIHFMLSKSLLSLFNYLPLFIFTPFAIKVIASNYDPATAVSWLLGVAGLIISNNFIAIFLKRQLVGNIKIVLGFGLAILLLAAADYFQLISISLLSSQLFSSIGGNSIGLVLIIGVITLSYYINYTFLKSNIYLEEIDSKRKKNTYKAVDTSFLKKYGNIGSLISMELKLIFRNKRPRSIFYLSAMFLFYGLIFYTQEVYIEGFSMLIFVGIFITGIFLTNYGQMLLSWNSNFFDKIITSNLKIREYFESKYWLFLVTSSAAFILSIPYVYFGWKVVLINLACYLFNIGINAFIIFYFSLKNPKKINLSKGASFNYEGVTATQFILILPILIIPVLLVLPFQLFGIPYMGLAFLGTSGIAGVLLKEAWFKVIEKRYFKRKHIIAAGFRNE